MRNLVLCAAIALPLSFVIAPASAFPGAKPGAVIGQSVSTDIIEVKRGGRGARGWARGHSFKPFGWSRGRKIDWRGMGCPPGHWKKGWC